MATAKKSIKELLRQRAEKLLSEKSSIFLKIENRDIKKLVHELQVHQIELEMQNEELRRAQAEIEESRTKYSDLYDFSPVGYFTFSRTGEIMEVNLTGATLLGIDRTKLLRREFSTFVDPEFRSLFRDHRLNVLGRGAKERCELKLIKKNGKSFHASLESILVPREKGGETGFRMRSAVSDITEFKKAQEKAETEHAFRIAVANSILSGIIATDPEGRQSYVNIGFCRMVGRSEEELIGRKPPFAYWPPEESDHISRAFQSIMDGKAPRDGLELRFVRKNGERFDALIVSSPLKDHRGKVIGLIATVGDISHIKQMEKELKELNAQLEERVHQRTAELETANEQLRQEITERKRAEEALKKNKERSEILSETAARLLAAEEPQKVVNELCQKVIEHLDCHVFINYLADEEKQCLHLNTYAGIPGEAGKEMEWLDYGVAVCGCAAQDASRIVSENIPATSDLRTELVKSFGIKAYACHPLFSAGRVIGTLSFGTRSRTTFTEEELSLMKTVADQVAIAMERIQLIDALRRSRDELEVRVQERTAELMDVVEALQDEMSERKRAQEAVEAERQRFNDVLEILPAYVVLLTPDHYVSFANRVFRERFGESQGKRCFEFLFDRSEPCEICETYTVLKTKSSRHWEWTGPDGRTYDVFDFPFTDAGGSTLILEMGIDITERKRAEEALREASLYNRSLIEASLDPLVTISAEGKIMDVNRATELVTGVGREELIGSDFSAYFTDREKAKDGYQQVFTAGIVRDYPLAIHDTSSKVTDVLYNATVYRNEAGEIQGVFAAARDITERKRAEEALRESEARLKYLSSQLLTVQENERRSIAREVHDSLGQSLSAIKFKVESVITDMRESGHKEIVKSLKTIVPIIQRSLEEARRIQMDLRPSVLDDLGIVPTLEWFCRDYQEIYSHIRIEKETHIKESDLSPELKTVIYRVMQEAMNNIAKHSKANLVRLSLNKKESKIELTIRDNGIGFDLEQVLDREASKRGLGLTSMRERIQLTGGSSVIESTPGQGTTLSAIWSI